MFKSQEIKDLEEKIYDKIAKEIEEGDIQKGLWTKAKAQSGFDDSQIESKYIQLRFNQLKEKSIGDHDAKVAERKQQEAEKKQEEKKRKKLSAGFSAGLWAFTFVIVWSNLYDAKTFGFETDEEMTSSLGQLLIFALLHICSIPFLLVRGKKIDRQKEYLEGVKPKGTKSSFNVRLALVLVALAIITWTISPIFTSQPGEDASIFMNDVIQGTSNSENQELVSIIRDFRDVMGGLEENHLPNTLKLLESDYLEYSSYETLSNVSNIKNLAQKASKEQLELPEIRSEVVSEFSEKIKNSSLEMDEKEVLKERIAKPLSQETRARITATHDYYNAIYNLYDFLETEYDNYFLKTDNTGGFEVQFLSNTNTSRYNDLIDQVNLKANTLDQSVANENVYLESILDSSGIDMSAEEFQAEMFGN